MCKKERILGINLFGERAVWGLCVCTGGQPEALRPCPSHGGGAASGHGWRDPDDGERGRLRSAPSGKQPTGWTLREVPTAGPRPSAQPSNSPTGSVELWVRQNCPHLKEQKQGLEEVEHFFPGHEGVAPAKASDTYATTLQTPPG